MKCKYMLYLKVYLLRFFILCYFAWNVESFDKFCSLYGVVVCTSGVMEGF